jgi:hypothetical protein
VLVILSLLTAQLLPAVEQTSVDSTTAAGDELKALRDQTIIESRIWLDTEWDQFKHGAEEARAFCLRQVSHQIADQRTTASISRGSQTGKRSGLLTHIDGKRYVVRADEKLAAFLELESVTRTANTNKLFKTRVLMQGGLVFLACLAQPMER